MAATVNIDCLLPTKVLVRRRCSSYQPIRDVKEALWKTAEFANLKSPEHYILVFVNHKAELETCTDESQRICDLHMFTPLMRVEEKVEETEATEFEKRMDVVIGKSKDSREQGATIGPELNDYWKNMAAMCQKVIAERNSFSWDEKVFYSAPPDIEGLGTPSASHREFIVSVWLSVAEQPHERVELTVLNTDNATSLIEKVRHHLPSRKELLNDDFVLKVCGLEEYLVGTVPLCRYSCVQKKLMRDKIPVFVMMPKSAVQLPLLSEQFVAPTSLKDWGTTRSNTPSMDTWGIRENLRVRVVNACRLAVPRDALVEAHVAVYFGDMLLSASRSTHPVRADTRCSTSVWSWGEVIDMDIGVSDLPCGACLCLELHAVSGGGMAGNETTKVPLVWVNQPLFGHNNILRSGSATLSCWPFDPEDPNNENLRYGCHGTKMLNPNLKDAPSIMIQYAEYPCGIVSYPAVAKSVEHGRWASTREDLPLPTGDQALELAAVISRPWVAQLNTHEKDLIWRFRKYLLDMPSSLSKILSSVKWNIQDDIAMMHYILSLWKQLPPVDSLELLGYAYQDPQVREFAVKSVAEFSDTELLQYLLQLCQALKYESHLDCPLGRLLLERAWKNKRIGHFLFWHLRSEIESPDVTLRFGLMLESYLRGSPNHLADLQKQVVAMEKMIVISELLHSKQFKDKVDMDLAHQSMTNLLFEENIQRALSGIYTSFLNPKLRLGELRASECTFFDSKGRPLLMVYQNTDILDELQTTAIIFKFGNDLHQDMLLLQIIRIMHKLWENEGLDLRVLPYGCVATGLNMGYIEVIRSAETIGNIHEKYQTSNDDLKVHYLYQWLQDHNPTETSLQEAMEAFCLSCAGYSVATYVLGIGDRHSDNIMITEDGQLFHIDFAHFLGNFKVKFGVRRERVPFVLPEEFELIINKHVGFDRFAKICEDAYIILRQNSQQFIRLLAMMVQTGMPELRSIDDLNYMRDALVLEMSESEAREHFRAKIQDARRNAWSTSLNWFFHGLAKETGD